MHSGSSCSQVDSPWLRYKLVNFGAGKSPGSPIFGARMDRYSQQRPDVDHADSFRIRGIPCRVKAEPLLCRVNGDSETDRCSSLGVAGGELRFQAYPTRIIDWRV